MAKQLTLIETQPDWRLDERTRRLGRRGVAKARAALQAGRHARAQSPPTTGSAQPPPRVRRSAA